MGILEGKVAIVTGATSGIGEGIAEVFVQEGAKVVVGARREVEGKALEIRLGPALKFIRTGVAIDVDVRAMLAHAVETFGRLDCLVNNAAIPSPMDSIVDIDPEQADRVMAVNVRGVFAGHEARSPLMIRQGSGRSTDEVIAALDRLVTWNVLYPRGPAEARTPSAQPARPRRRDVEPSPPGSQCCLGVSRLPGGAGSRRDSSPRPCCRW